MSNIEPRRSYTPRRVREQRAYRLVVTGGVTGAAGAVTLVLAIAGAIGYTLPVVLLVVAAVCAVLFRGMTRPR